MSRTEHEEEVVVGTCKFFHSEYKIISVLGGE